MPAAVQIEDRIAMGPDGCWCYTGPLNHDGYSARLRVGNAVRMYPHRIMYEKAKGKVPAGLQLDHLCRNRRCVNPDHLEPVTVRENKVRSTSLITHCPSGHPYDEANTYWRPDRVAGRMCRTCVRSYKKAG